MTTTEFFLLLSAIYIAPRLGPIFGNAAGLFCLALALLALVLRLP